MNRTAIMVFILILCGLVINASANQEVFDKGIHLLRQGKFNAAVDVFSQVIDQEPSNRDAYRNRGVAYIKLNKFDAAISDFEAALKAGADHNGIYSNLGVAWYYKQDYPKAILYCNKEIELNPNNHYAYFNRALCWAASEKFAKAYSDVLKSLDLKSSYYPALCLKADLLVETGEESAAIETYKTAYHLAPDQDYAAKRLADMGAPPKTAQPMTNKSTREALPQTLPSLNSSAVPPPEKKTAPPNLAAQYALQVGGFKIKENAERMKIKLSNKGLSPRILEIEDSGGNHWHLVRIGAYKTQALAQKALEQTRDLLGIDVVIRPYGKL